MKNIFVCSNHGSYFCNGTLDKIIIVGKIRERPVSLGPLVNSILGPRISASPLWPNCIHLGDGSVLTLIQFVTTTKHQGTTDLNRDTSPNPWGQTMRMKQTPVLLSKKMTEHIVKEEKHSIIQKAGHVQIKCSDNPSKNRKLERKVPPPLNHYCSTS